MLNKILKRIEESNYFNPTYFYSDTCRKIRRYEFDDKLNIDFYNGLYRVMFKGQILNHYHSDKKDGFHSIYKAIKSKKDKIKNKVLAEL